MTEIEGNIKQMLEDNYSKNAKHRVQLLMFALLGVVVFFLMIFIYFYTGFSFMSEKLKELETTINVLEKEHQIHVIEEKLRFEALKQRVDFLEGIMNVNMKENKKK